MPLVILLVQVALSLVFGLAGVTKLLDLAGTRRTIKDFGAPDSTVELISFLLPLTEIAVAVFLLFSSSALYASYAALVLLTLFIVVVGASILRGQTTECHCFGQVYSRPVGWSTLLRNGVFTLGAIVLIWRSSNLSSITSSAVGLGVFLTLLIVLGLSILVLRKQRRVESAQPVSRGLAVGTTAPLFDLPHYEGGTGSLPELLAQGKQVLLIFTSPLCGPCVSLFQEIGEWQRTHGNELTVAIVSRGTIKENFVNTVRNGLQNVLLQNDHEVADLYLTNVTPAGVMIRKDGTIGSLVAKGADEIRVLLKSTLTNSDGHPYLDSAGANTSTVGNAFLQTE
jgi:uncharacterized membrane protein YphA (DoxX/SURF4 family)/peroxiredoxin